MNYIGHLYSTGAGEIGEIKVAITSTQNVQSSVEKELLLFLNTLFEKNVVFWGTLTCAL